MAYLNGNMNIMRFVTRESEAPRYKGIFPLAIDSVGGAVSEWYMYGNKQGVGEKQIVKGNLPLDFVSDGTNLENYRIFGTAEGGGVETENLCPTLSNWVDGFINPTGDIASPLPVTREKSSDFIEISPNTVYTFGFIDGFPFIENNPAWRGTAYYDENQTFISRTANYLIESLTDTSPVNAKYVRLTYRTYGQTNSPMFVEGSTAPDHYIPYGYQIPFTVSQQGQTDKNYDIYIGDSPLLSGDYIDYKSGKIYKAKRIHEDTVTIDGIEWDILDYDHDEVYKADGTRAKHTVTIQTHDIVNELQYSAKQAAFAFPYGLVAGTYHFTVGAQPWFSGDVGKVLTFTLENAIPTGGQLVFNGAHNRTLVGTTISAFTSPTSTTVAETVTMTEGNTGTDLGTILRSKTDAINIIDRALLGSNNWLEIAMRQYLNSDKAAGSVWTPQSVFDRPPTWASATAGFLNGKSADFLSHIGTAKKTTGLNNISDGGGTAVHDEKFFLLSRSEVYMGDEYTGGEDTPYAYYKNYSDNQSASTGADKNRIKYRAGVARGWWLRSPDAGSAAGVGLVLTSGAWSSSRATNATGVAPACCIVLDDMDDWVKQTFYTETTVDLPAIETFNGDNTLDSTETLGETTVTQGYTVPLDIRSLSDTNEINERCDYHTDGDGATIELDEKTGTITINGTTGDTGARVWIVPDRLQGSYWYSGVPKNQDIAYAKMVPLSSVPYYNKWDGTPPDPSTDFDYGEGAEVLCDISLANYPQYILYFAPNHTFNNFVVKPKIQKATIIDTKNIYVGNKLLGEGEMVSRESTSLDITLERGQSVFETTLTNKPEMIVTPDSYEKIKDMLLNTEQYDYNETQTDYIIDEVTEVTQ